MPERVTDEQIAAWRNTDTDDQSGTLVPHHVLDFVLDVLEAERDRADKAEEELADLHRMTAQGAWAWAAWFAAERDYYRAAAEDGIEDLAIRLAETEGDLEVAREQFYAARNRAIIAEEERDLLIGMNPDA